MKKILITSLAAVSVAGLMSGGTFALLSASASVEGHDFDAGTLEVAVDSPTTASWSVDEMFPSMNREKDHVISAASSDNDAKGDLYVTFKNFVELEDGCNGNEQLVDPNGNDCGFSSSNKITYGGEAFTPGKGELAENVIVKLYSAAPKAGGGCEGENHDSASGNLAREANGGTAPKLSELADLGPIRLPAPTADEALDAGDELCVQMILDMGAGVTDVVQGDAFTMDTQYDLIQRVRGSDTPSAPGDVAGQLPDLP